MKKKKTPRMTCNCWPKWCLFCCGSRKNSKKKTTDKKKKNREASKQIHALENIEEGTNGTKNAEKSPEAMQLKLEKKFGQSLESNNIKIFQFGIEGDAIRT